jgi:hypothetical protein
MVRMPGLTYRAFCEPCTDYITTCLDELPAAYERLAAEIGEPSRAGFTGHVPFGPREPLRKDIDALTRLTAGILGGWAARVRTVARLSQPDPQRDPASLEAVTDAADILKDHAAALLALPPGWMTRTYPLHPGRHGKPAKIPPELADLLADEEIVRIGVDYLTVTTRLGGAAAGNEIIDLWYRARKILGETRAPTETFDGVPCRNCEDMALERAEPPSDPKLPAMKSRCASCSDMMTADEFAGWASRYAQWAQSARLPACRRCSRGQHDQCSWLACPCRNAGHSTAALAA